MNNKILIDKDVKYAIKNKQPIVSLESTLISHGLPYPLNIEVAKKSIKVIKSTGSLPATIGIIDGYIKIGLNDEDINILAKKKNVQKISRHNIALAMKKNSYASTTVASTMMISSLVGIKVFSTGGIGGVHRNSQKTYDISSDLIELHRKNMIVVSSGAKSILDIFKTNELLETLGVTKIGYKVDNVPGFWCRKTNLNVDLKINNLQELLKIIENRNLINQNGSILIYNPVEKKYSIKNNDIEKWINKAQKKAEKYKIKGKELTPYLLKEISELSKGKTIKANMSLIINNTKLAGKIANKMNKILWKK